MGQPLRPVAVAPGPRRYPRTRGIRARGAKLPVQAGATAPACPAVKKRPAGPIPEAEHPGQRHGRRQVHPPHRQAHEVAPPHGGRRGAPGGDPRDAGGRGRRGRAARGGRPLALRAAEGGQADARRDGGPADRPAARGRRPDRGAGQARRGQPAPDALAHRPEARGERARPAARDPRQARGHPVQVRRPRLVRPALQHPEPGRHRHHPLAAAGDRRPGSPVRERGAAAGAGGAAARAPGGAGPRAGGRRGAGGPEPEDRAGPEAGRALGDPPGRHQAHQEDPRQRRAGRRAGDGQERAVQPAHLGAGPCWSPCVFP